MRTAFMRACNRHGQDVVLIAGLPVVAVPQVLGHHLGLAPWATQQALHLAGASAK